MIPLAALPIAVDPAGIPDSLKEHPRRWVAWRPRPRKRGGKPEKVPVNPATNRAAKTSDQRTWGSFDMAYRLYRDKGLAGVGFMFAGDGITGVDLDGCRCPESGALDPWAGELVSALGTYAEVSPSGMGVKLIARGQLDPMGRNRHGSVEMYDRLRFFAITGHRLPDAPSVVEACQEALTALQRGLAGGNRQHPAAQATLTGDGYTGPDETLLDIAFGARNGATIFALWNGDLLHHPSFSEALLALAQYLAFYTGPDEDRLEHLMMASPLLDHSESQRPKWCTRRVGGTWGRVCVIRKAIQTCLKFYSGPCGVAHNTYTGGVVSGTENAVEKAWMKVKAGEIPIVASQLAIYRLKGLKELAALCYHLGASRGGQFCLGGRTVEKVVGIPARTAARRLRKLQELSLIRVVRKSRYFPAVDQGFANEYKWIGEEQRVMEAS